MAAFSSRGPTMYDYAAKPDLVAPGYGTISLSDPLSSFYTTKAQFLLRRSADRTGYTPYLALSGTSMAAPVVAGTVALMLQANPNLTPNLVKAILQFTAQEYPGYDALTQGTGFLNARGAVQLAEYFATTQPGQRLSVDERMEQADFLGQQARRGGVLTPGGTAWGRRRLGLDARTGDGDNIVWGDELPRRPCDNIVWGNNIVGAATTTTSSGATATTTSSGATPVTTTSSGATAADDDNIVWGNSDDDDNIVWGNA